MTKVKEGRREGEKGVEGRSVMRGENGAATSLSYALFAEG